jgi:hypothetical protein
MMKVICRSDTPKNMKAFGDSLSIGVSCKEGGYGAKKRAWIILKQVAKLLP